MAAMAAVLAIPGGLAAHGEDPQPGGQPSPFADRDRDNDEHDARKDHPRQITILQTTDLHDHANGAGHVGLDVDPIAGTSLTGAYARIAAYVSDVRASAGHPVILVDSGDWTMGTLYDLTLGERPLAPLFIELLRYDCVTLGNHEFDYTPKGLAQILGAAQQSFGFRTPIVASNMDLAGNADLAPLVGHKRAIRSEVIEELPNGIKVGYLGIMGRSAARDAAASAPVRFVDPAANYAAIQDKVDRMRREGVDVVIALSHSGTNAAGTAGEDVDLAAHVSGINVIASGHTHTPLASAHAVSNGGWTTAIIDAGFAGANVSRIDLTYHSSTRTTTVDASSNRAMTDASLSALRPGLAPDSFVASIVEHTDRQLNVDLGAFFSQTFADYTATNLGTGIYHPVGSAAQDMVSNAADLLPAPNGLGDLAADAIRSVPNRIVGQTLAAVGGNPANLPGYDFTPFQAAAVASGLLRGALEAGVPLSFADVYSVLPLGLSPDSTQALPVGFPLISLYLDPADVKKLCGLQLVVQTGLASGDFYLNLSGVRCSLAPAASYVYFKFATAASVLQVTSQKAGGGSTAALRALAALSSLGADNGAGLLAAYAANNPYAVAMVKLNDASPIGSQIVDNLGALGQVAAAAAADRANGSTLLSTLVVSKAVAAIDTVAGFAPGDAANIGPAANLSSAVRIRVAADLFAVLFLDAIQAEFGVAITAYASATGPTTLSGADLPGILANRIDAAPASTGVQELKEWMALLGYIRSGLGGSIPPAYASTSNFAQFGAFGVAVRTRNASYPLASIGQLITTLGSLVGGP